MSDEPVDWDAHDLAAVRRTFTRWLGADYDLDVLETVLATAAVAQLDGDPVWLLVVSGSGNAKTETVQALAGAGATVTSTITSEGALLSATPKKETAAGASGGLLRKLGHRAVLVIKDVTSILSMNRDARAGVLAALREVYDGRWERNVGTDGGKTLEWEGRLVVVGAVTTAWDTHHGVIAAMGDRFALIRSDSTTGRIAAGRQALRNVGSEEQMRAELATAVGGLLRDLHAPEPLTDEETDALLGVADIVTLARTAVEKDFKGDVVDAQAPEMPTRFAKMLGQVVRGAMAIGATRQRGLELALRVARDSMPPLRLACLADVAAHPGTTLTETRERLQRPRTTVDRALQEVHVLGLTEQRQEPAGMSGGSRWHYTLAPGVDETALARLLTRNVTTGTQGHEVEPFPDTDISGEPCQVCGEPLAEADHLVDSSRHAACEAAA
jgi:hypothetical protein